MEGGTECKYPFILYFSTLKPSLAGIRLCLVPRGDGSQVAVGCGVQQMDAGLVGLLVHVFDQLVHVLEVHPGVLVLEVVSHSEHDVVLVLVVIDMIIHVVLKKNQSPLQIVFL